MNDIKVHSYVRQGMNENEFQCWINDDFDVINITDEDVKNAISIPAFIKRGLKMIRERFFKSSKRSASMPSICNCNLLKFR